MISKMLIPLALVMISLSSQSQINKQLLKFREDLFIRISNGDANQIKKDNEMSGPGFNYLGYLTISYINEFNHLNKIESNACYDALSQAVSFLGDYKSALEYGKDLNNIVDTNMVKSIRNMVNSYSNASLIDARKIIIDSAKKRNVIMFNEAHNKPLNRAFIYSLLTDLYKIGYRHLAMETLRNGPNNDLSEPVQSIGYYTNEPIYGELIRKALSLGFELVPYEDTASRSTIYQRDSAQATHIYEFLNKFPEAKLIVVGGYGHIGEGGDSGDYIPMGFQFKRLSGIDPLTIDQTFLTEEGNSAFSGLFYNILERSFSINVPSILIQDEKPVDFIFSRNSFDLVVLHPRTAYYKQRAAWYALDGRIPRDIKSKNKNAFLIQAYAANEWTKFHEAAIPIDQSYIVDENKNVYLFLRTGVYQIVFKDKRNKIIRQKKIFF